MSDWTCRGTVKIAPGMGAGATEELRSPTNVPLKSRRTMGVAPLPAVISWRSAVICETRMSWRGGGSEVQDQIPRAGSIGVGDERAPKVHDRASRRISSSAVSSLSTAAWRVGGFELETFMSSRGTPEIITRQKPSSCRRLPLRRPGCSARSRADPRLRMLGEGTNG